MKLLIMTAMVFALCGSLLAQERAASGAAETQMTWSALTDQINAFSTKIDGVNSRIDQVVACAKKGMIYAPGAAGVDGQGCLEASQAGVTTNNMTNLTNKINNLTTSLNTTNNTVNSLNGSVNNVLSCGASGKSFNGGGCVGSTPSCSLSQRTASSCSAGEVAITTLQTQHSGAGGRGGTDYNVAVTYCVSVSCH